MSEMSLREWVSDEERLIASFEKLWMLRNASAPEVFLLEMDPGEWDDQYRAFQETVAPNPPEPT